jgi:hypothetical protein
MRTKSRLAKPFANADFLGKIYSLVRAWYPSVDSYAHGILSATKVRPGTIGYEKTAEGIDESMRKLGLGAIYAFLLCA